MATLVYSDVDGVDRSLALGHEPVTIGRAPECAIRSADPRVSRMHARFYVDQGTLWVEDLGSSNGIFVGANKVQRAPVPTGEIILVGSLMIRLLPASGTLPPPMGLHGTLATWLDLERKNRAAVEDERDAFARRVGELHQQIEFLKTSPTVPPGTTMPQIHGVAESEAIRLRDEAEARAATLEQALKAVQDELEALREVGRRNSRASVRGEMASEELAELVALRDKVAGLERELKDRADWSSNVGVESAKLTAEIQRLQNALDEAQAAQSTNEHTHGELMREAAELRDQLDVVRRSSAAEIEIAKLEAAKSREQKMVAETAVGMQAAEKLAEADMVIARLEKQVAELKAAQAGPDAKAAQLQEQIAALIAKADKVEKDLAQAQIRAQGAERNLSGATAQAAKAETKAAQLEQKLKEAEERTKSAEHEVAKALERVAQLDARLGSGEAPLQAAEQRAAKIATELVEMTTQFETRRDRLVEVEKALSAAGETAKAADTKAAEAKAEAEKLAAKLAETEAKAAGLQGKLDQLATADSAIAAATQARDESAAKAQASDKRVAEAERRAMDAEQRASAADTMAKAMAKDVAEALRRAADADTRAKSVHRDLADAHRRADEGTAKAAEAALAMEVADKRVVEAETAAQKIEKELGEKLEATQKELTGKLEATQKELSAKLESTQRELSAERSGLLALVDRKTALEREVADMRAQVPALTTRAEDAERKLAEAEVQIETLQERVTDLESGLAVSETAATASREELLASLTAAEGKIVQLDAAAARTTETIDGLRARIAELEKLSRDAQEGRSVAEAALEQARAEIADLARTSEVRASTAVDEQQRIEDALARADEAEQKIESLAARAEAADMAIGRASALQLQLDGALAKLTSLETEAAMAKRRDAQAAGEAESMVAERVAVAENRASAAEAKLADYEAKLHDYETRIHDAEQNATNAREEIAEALERIKDAEMRAARADEVARASAGNADAEARAQSAEQKLAAAQTKLAALQKEVDAAENVRSFAAETEREIAQFQRDLKDARAKLTQMTLERDRLESELKDARQDEDTTNRSLPTVRDKRPSQQMPAYDGEVTAQADLSKYTEIIAKSVQLQDRVKKLEKEDAELREQLASAEAKLREAIDADEEGAESTSTGSQLPIALAEHVSVLEEAVDSLRSNMRAASDETAMMEMTPAVTIVSDAISAAAEHIERARGAIRSLQQAIGM
ncbi:MAG: FHA domain-containing protein [Deltaproteobacteria bacterium]|nr:FHA domain-containing protein [Deltaproteobacteria bacterium]